MVKKNIDGGKAFDWGRTSEDYAKYRDLYPQPFYEAVLAAGLCAKGQRVLDLGTGTGVLPRNLYEYGAQFVGADVSPEQIEQARRLSQAQGKDIQYVCARAEDVDFPSNTFDTVTACQCFSYFDHAVLAENVWKMLKKGGKFGILYLAWLPFEDKIAQASEELVLQYNPVWSGCKETRHEIVVPEVYLGHFEVERSEVFDVQVAFTRESWNGRMKSCRGIGASLAPEECARFEAEHRQLLARLAPETFTVLHYAAMTVLRAKA